MTVTREVNFYSFEFWGPAVNFIQRLTHTEAELIWDQLEVIVDIAISETELNDLFAYDNDILCEWIGYEDFEEFWNERSTYEYGFDCNHLQRI